MYRNLIFKNSSIDDQKNDERRYKNLDLGGRPVGDNESINSDDRTERMILRGVTNKVFFENRAGKRSGNFSNFGAKDLGK